MELLLIRHGQSHGNVHPEVDMPDAQLTELGHRQARLLAGALRGERISRLIASPLHRSIQTARPLSQALRTPIDVWPDLREIRMGSDALGSTAAEWSTLHPDVPRHATLDDDGWRYPGGETDDSAAERAAQVVERVRAFADTAERVALIAHGGFNSFLIRALLGVAGHHTWVTQLNTAVNRFHVASDFVIVHTLNNVEHLPGELRS